MASEGTADHPNKRELMDRIASHLSGALSDEARKNRTGARINRVLFDGILTNEDTQAPQEPLTPDDEVRYGVMEAYMNLAQMPAVVGQCEFYFRRFPFGNLPVSRSDHLRNVCEMYFDRVIQFRDRLKKALNVCREQGVIDNQEVSRILKIFDRVFAFEHRSRNQTHHSNRFDYTSLNQLGLAEMLGKSLPAPISQLLSPQTLYRKAAKQWVERVKARTDGLEKIVEHVAGLILQCPPIAVLPGKAERPAKEA